MDYRLEAQKFHKELTFTSTGVIEPERGHKLLGEKSINVIVENVQGDNRILVKGKLTGQKNWIQIGELVGPSACAEDQIHPIDISRYDLIQFEVEKYSPFGNEIPKLIASGYYSPANGNTIVEAQLQRNNEYLLQIQYLLEDTVKQLKTLNSHMEDIQE
jgi:hypothetical protein